MRSILLCVMTVWLAIWAGDVRAQDPSLVLTDGGIQFPDGSILSSAEGSASYEQVIVVAKSGGAFTSIQAALDSIQDATYNRRYLVWVGPGTYTERVTLKQNVNVQGAGAGVTTIVYPGGPELNTGTVVGSDYATLSQLTVRSEGWSEGASLPFAVAIYNHRVRPRIEGVSAVALEADQNYAIYNYLSSPKIRGGKALALRGTGNYAVFNSTFSKPELVDTEAEVVGGFVGSSYGVYNEVYSKPRLRRVEITCSIDTTCYGVYSTGAGADLRDVDIYIGEGSHGGYGVWNQDSSPLITNSLVHVWLNSSFEAYAVYNTGASNPAIHHSRLGASTHPLSGGAPKVASTQLMGTLDDTLPEGSCVGAYDWDYEPLNSSCTKTPASP